MSSVKKQHVGKINKPPPSRQNGQRLTECHKKKVPFSKEAYWLEYWKQYKAMHEYPDCSYYSNSDDGEEERYYLVNRRTEYEDTSF